ncbi:mediator complex subunit 13 C-terminal-domain-containing protein [Polychytrium aggregatum]|uniref:mediator complex subunit 13 C-terminal-domain-containing protein n=1 Tax=Polychytrium aggregatum TaxID=110093 RepID=UPI0022FF3364|nr:mediator complex subunit 13 C-terminal-domain-containing protein [Polychytrium aggregatum]KAI9206953.1 mediator complex subunit 13 C-terminal-domain-containing protein [Polychytrium aggregatum]
MHDEFSLLGMPPVSNNLISPTNTFFQSTRIEPQSEWSLDDNFDLDEADIDDFFASSSKKETKSVATPFAQPLSAASPAAPTPTPGPATASTAYQPMSPAYATPQYHGISTPFGTSTPKYVNGTPTGLNSPLDDAGDHFMADPTILEDPAVDKSERLEHTSPEALTHLAKHEPFRIRVLDSSPDVGTDSNVPEQWLSINIDHPTVFGHDGKYGPGGKWSYHPSPALPVEQTSAMAVDGDDSSDTSSSSDSDSLSTDESEAGEIHEAPVISSASYQRSVVAMMYHQNIEFCARFGSTIGSTAEGRPFGGSSEPPAVIKELISDGWHTSPEGIAELSMFSEYMALGVDWQRELEKSYGAPATLSLEENVVPHELLLSDIGSAFSLLSEAIGRAPGESRGPLSIEQYHDIHEDTDRYSKYGKFALKKRKRQNDQSVLEAFPSPDIVVSHKQCPFLRLNVSAVPFWGKLGLKSYSGPKDIKWLSVVPPAPEIRKNLMAFCEDVGAMYEAYQYGHYARMGNSNVTMNSGILKIDVKGAGTLESDVAAYIRTYKAQMKTLADYLVASKGIEDLAGHERSYIVVYIVNPFEHRTEILLKLLSGYDHLLQLIAEKTPRAMSYAELRYRIVPAILPHSVLTERYAPGSFSSVRLVMDGIYRSCRRVLSKSGDQSAVSPLFAPPFVAAQALVHPQYSLAGRVPSSPHLVMEPDRLLHVSYAIDSRWVSVLWCDAIGELMECASFNVDSCGGRRGVFHEIWARTLRITKMGGFLWRIILARNKSIGNAELEDWKWVLSDFVCKTSRQPPTANSSPDLSWASELAALTNDQSSSPINLSIPGTPMEVPSRAAASPLSHQPAGQPRQHHRAEARDIDPSGSLMVSSVSIVALAPSSKLRVFESLRTQGALPVMLDNVSTLYSMPQKDVSIAPSFRNFGFWLGHHRVPMTDLVPLVTGYFLNLRRSPLPTMAAFSSTPARVSEVGLVWHHQSCFADPKCTNFSLWHPESEHHQQPSHQQNPQSETPTLVNPSHVAILRDVLKMYNGLSALSGDQSGLWMYETVESIVNRLSSL